MAGSRLEKMGGAINNRLPFRSRSIFKNRRGGGHPGTPLATIKALHIGSGSMP